LAPIPIDISVLITIQPFKKPFFRAIEACINDFGFFFSVMYLKMAFFRFFSSIDNLLYFPLKGDYHYSIGGCVSPRKATEAIGEGFILAPEI